MSNSCIKLKSSIGPESPPALQTVNLNFEFDETIEINVTVWNMHSDPLYGVVGYAQNHTKTIHVQMPFIQADWSVDAPEDWLIDDGSKRNKNTSHYYYQGRKKVTTRVTSEATRVTTFLSHSFLQ